MFFIREEGNVIDYEIPITGNLKDPKFHLTDVITDVLENIFIKPAKTSYRKQVKNNENVIEKSLTLKWKMRQGSILNHQEKFINKMVDFLINNPKASIKIYPMQFAEKEKEYIEFFEAKKKYFLFSKNKKSPILNEDDSIEIERMSIKNAAVIDFLDKQVKTKMLFTVQEKCRNFIGDANIDAKFNLLIKQRKDAFGLEFKKRGIENRVKIFDSENNVPYNGFSFYKIEYQGELPNALIKAYEHMNEFNNESPRKWFKKDREKIPSTEYKVLSTK
jgi:hypothetical protein